MGEKGVRGVQGVAGVQGGGFADQEWPQKNAKKDEEKSHAKQTSPHLPFSYFGQGRKEEDEPTADEHRFTQINSESTNRR